jgi:outer membrane protein, heavy metal efflux system
MPQISESRSHLAKIPILRRFFGRVSSIASCCLGVFGTAGAVPPAHAAEPPTEATLIGEVCRTGPATKLARALQQRGSAAVSAAQVLPNPSLVLEYQATLGRGDDREAIVGIELPLEINGRRQLLQGAAAARQTQANAEATLAQFETALAFREDYVAALAAQAEAEVLGSQQVALEALSAVIQSLAGSGEASGYELARQQMQADLHRRTLETKELQSESSRARLEGWIGREVQLPANALQALLKGAQVPAGRLDASGSPDIQSSLAAANASALEGEAARRRWIPDLDVFAGYRSIAIPEGSGHGVALRLGIPLTFFDHGQGEAAAADAEYAIAQASADRLRRTRSVELKTLQQIYSQSVTSVEGAAQVSARSLALQATAQKLYAAGEATLTDLFEAFRNAEEARLAELRLALEIAHVRLALMRSAGTLLDPMLDRACGGAKPGVSP